MGLDSATGQVRKSQSGLGSIQALAEAAAQWACVGQADEQHDGGGDQSDTVHQMQLIKT